MTQARDAGSGLTVVIPAYNEGRVIAQSVAAVRQALDGVRRPSEVLVVDDGSTDDTARHAAEAGATVIQHVTNAGYGRAVLSGIEAARSDTIVIVDADGTYPIDALPELLSRYDEGFDMVVGARRGPHYAGSVGKLLLRWLFQALAEFTCGRSIPDINSGFRIFRRPVVLAWVGVLPPGFSFTTTITLLFLLTGRFVAYVPVSYGKRIGNSKVRLLPDSLRALQIIVTTIAQFNPLKVFLLLLMAGTTGNLILAVLAWLVPAPAMVWMILALGWNVGCVLIAAAMLALVLIRPRGGFAMAPEAPRWTKRDEGPAGQAGR